MTIATTDLMALPEELLQFKTTIRRFVDEELIPHERVGTIPEAELPRLHTKVRELGVWAASVPVEFGGAGLNALEYAVLVEELHRSVFGIEIETLGMVIGALLAGTPEQMERYVRPTVRGERRGAFGLTESTGGADPGSSIQTTAKRDGERWILNGRKCFISESHKADYWVIVAVTDESRRQHGGMTAFIVDRGTPGFEIVRYIETMGAMSPAELDLHDVIVDDSQRLGEIGQGFRLAQTSLSGQRIAIGARAVGLATRMLEMAIDYGRSRQVFGKLLGEHGATQAVIADCAIETESLRWLVYRACAEDDRGNDTRLLQSGVKFLASELMSRVSDKVLQLHGGWGYSKDLPIERFYRDSRMYRIVEGPNEVHRMVVARNLLKSGITALTV